MKKLLIVFLSVFVLYSCNKDEVITEELIEKNRLEKTEENRLEKNQNDLNDIFTANNVELKRDILSFPNNDAFMSVLHYIEQNDILEKTLNEFEKSIGFYSFRRLYQETLDLLVNAANENEFNSLVNQYEDIVERETFYAQVKLKYIMPLINSSRLIEIDGVLYKYTKDAVILAYDGTLASLEIVEKTKKSSDYGYYYIPEVLGGRSGCPAIYYEWRENEDGNRAGRMNYEVSKDIRYGEKETVEEELVWNTDTQSWEIKETTTTEEVAEAVILNFYVEGVAFKKAFWSWHAYNTSLDLKGVIRIESDGALYSTLWRLHKNSAKTISHSATWYPAADVSNVGGFDVDRVYAFFDTRGLEQGNEIEFHCE